MIRFTSLMFLFLTTGRVVVAQEVHADSSQAKNEILWIQKTLDNWDSACRKDLNLRIDSLPWIIFYDSVAAWHLNANEKMLPSFQKTNSRFLFNKKYYELVRIPHRYNLWVPDRNPIAIGSLPTTAIPYANNQKTFFIASLPSLFHLLAPASEAVYMDYLFLGMNIHELTHTLQLPSVLPRLIQIEKSYKLPESIDDNTIEIVFSKSEAYKNLFLTEKTLLWNALFNENRDSSIVQIREALKITERRKKDFFSGDSLGYSKMEDIFISLEGSAMWMQYKTMLRNVPAGMDKEGSLSWLLQRTASWSQEEGLALILLIDKFDPNWKQQFFGKELPDAFQYLRNLVSTQKTK